MAPTPPRTNVVFVPVYIPVVALYEASVYQPTGSNVVLNGYARGFVYDTAVDLNG